MRSFLFFFTNLSGVMMIIFSLPPLCDQCCFFPMQTHLQVELSLTSPTYKQKIIFLLKRQLTLSIGVIDNDREGILSHYILPPVA